MKPEEIRAAVEAAKSIDIEEVRRRALHSAESGDCREYEIADSGIMPDGSAMEDFCIRSIPHTALSVADSSPYDKPAEKNLHARHREKVRKRYLDEGLSGFQKHQILELLLFYAIPRIDTNEIAHRLLNAFHGNISEVFDADVESLKKISGVGDSAAILLSMMPQVFRVYREERMQREGVHGRQAVEQYIANRFTGEQVERVLITCLDNGWNLIGDEFVGEGSVNISTVNMRQLMSACLRYNPTAAIIAHNHPRGTALPSREDLTTTVEVRRALEVIGVRLIDHLIVAKEDYISLACSRQYYDLF